MRSEAVKVFEIEAGSTTNMWYEISVYFRGQLVQNFLEPTMEKAWRAFERAGYRTTQTIY